MAIGAGSLVEITMNCNLQGQQAQNVYQYIIQVWTGGTDAVGLGKAWWNHVKTLYRGVATEEFAGLFQSVRVRELDSLTGDYGEYNVPAGEQAGLRVSSGGSELLPPFVSAGARLTVGSRVTRPGQKRLFGFTEGDNVSGYINTAPYAAVGSFLDLVTDAMVLGAPALLTEIVPVIVRKDIAGLPVAHQNVTGYVQRVAFTSQVSRKFGRGA